MKIFSKELFKGKYTVSQKKDMPIMYHISSKNRRLAITFDLINRSSMLDNLPLKLLI